MRKFLLVAGMAGLTIVWASCGGGGSKPAEKKDDTQGSNISDNPVYQKGMGLAKTSGCFQCHDVRNKVSGPAYQEVANKYADQPDSIVTHLAKKIVAGGEGVWGEVPMPPQPVTQEDAEALVRYILLLK
jgi:cytochrome c